MRATSAGLRVLLRKTRPWTGLLPTPRSWTSSHASAARSPWGVDDRDSVTRVNITRCEIEHERRFSDTRLAHMPLALLAREDDAAAGGGRRNRNRLGLHNVA